MKKCQYCAEKIQDEAIKCRFCKSLFNYTDVENGTNRKKEINLKDINQEKFVKRDLKLKSGSETFIKILIGLIVARGFSSIAMSFFPGGTINIIEVPIWIVACIIAYKMGMFKLEGTFGIGKKKV